MKTDLNNQEIQDNNLKLKIIKKHYKENLFEQINEKQEEIINENNQNHLWHKV